MALGGGTVSSFDSIRAEELSDAYHEGFGAGMESADSDRDKAIAAARAAGFDAAVAALRDDGRVRKWRSQADGWPWLPTPHRVEYADYLAAVKAEVLGTQDGVT